MTELACLRRPEMEVRGCIRNLKMGVQRLHSSVRNLIMGVHCFWNNQNSGVHYSHFLKTGEQCTPATPLTHSLDVAWRSETEASKLGKSNVDKQRLTRSKMTVHLHPTWRMCQSCPWASPGWRQPSRKPFLTVHTVQIYQRVLNKNDTPRNHEISLFNQLIEPKQPFQANSVYIHIQTLSWRPI